jgi:hypothetical protein
VQEDDWAKKRGNQTTNRLLDSDNPTTHPRTTHLQGNPTNMKNNGSAMKSRPKPREKKREQKLFLSPSPVFWWPNTTPQAY